MGGSSIASISFIDSMGWGGYVGTVYYKSGQSWKEFCESSYNTYGFYCDDDRVLYDIDGVAYMIYGVDRSGTSTLYQVLKPAMIVGVYSEHMYDEYI